MTTKGQLQLDKLPAELIRRIATHGTVNSARSLLYVNRALYHICKDWTIYRDIVHAGFNERGPKNVKSSVLLIPLPWMQDSDFTDPSEHDEKYATWARLAFADFKATRFLEHTAVFTESSFTQWAPHLIALHHPILSLVEPKDLAELVSDNAPDDEFIPENQIDESIAFKFCRLACMMSREADFRLSVQIHSRKSKIYRELTGGPLPYGNGHFYGRLYSLQPFPTISEGPYSRTRGHDPGSPLSLVMKLAYKALFLFDFEIRVGLAYPAHYVVAHPQHALTVLPVPPKAENIPFPSFMSIPIPFALCSAEMFGLCHLPRMASPEFMSNGEWSGYAFIPWSHHICTRTHQGIQFSAKIDENNPDYLLLDSYNVDGPPNSVYLKGKLGRYTGKMDISEHRPAQGKLGWSWQAVLTPFGIVGSGKDGGNRVWMWLWKTEWSNLMVPY